jgi:hypothetical protein
LDRRLSGPQSQSGCGGEEKNSQPLPGLKTPIIHPVASSIPLSYPSSSRLYDVKLNKLNEDGGEKKYIYI